MMDRTTLREVKEALAAARLGESKPTATPMTAELEALAEALKSEVRNSPLEGDSVESPTEEPNKPLVPTGHANDGFPSSSAPPA